MGQPGDGTIDVLMVAHQSADTIASRVKDFGRRDRVAAVIVVDHGDDGSAELAEGAGAVVVHDPSNPGRGAGLNRAARLATADFLLLTDPAVELEDGALEHGVTALSARPITGAVEGMIRTLPSGQLEVAGGREPSPLDLLGRAVNARVLLRFRPVAWIVARGRRIGQRGARRTSAREVVATLPGAAVLVRREAFMSVDGFDEGCPFHGEGLDLCRRLRREGWELAYVPVPWALRQLGDSPASWESELRWWEGTLAFAARWWSIWSFRSARIAGAVMFLRLAVAEPRRAREAYAAIIGGFSAAWSEQVRAD